PSTSLFLSLCEYVGAIVTEFVAEVVDQFESPHLGDAGEDRMLRKRRTLADLAATGVVGDAADDRGPDRGRTDDRMRFATERGQRLVEFVEGGSGQAHGFASVVDEVDLVEPQGRDDDDLTVVVLRAGPGAAGQAGVGRLRDDDEVVIDADLQSPPQVDEAARLEDREYASAAEPVALGIVCCGPAPR